VKKLYIIAGPNGAGKTTLSYTILPEIFDCNEYVNADEIARGISPFNAEKANIWAGRLMLNRIQDLIEAGESFAIETTLATKSYKGLIKQAQAREYEVILLFLALESVKLAIKRVSIRVNEGGHNIPTDVIERRYLSGLKNLLKIYIPIVDKWLLVDNSNETFEFIAEGRGQNVTVSNHLKWTEICKNYN